MELTLYETAIINILNRISQGEITIDDIIRTNIPNDIIENITEYSNKGIHDAFLRSVTNGHFQIANFFYNQVPKAEQHILLEISMEDQAMVGNTDGINYLLSNNKTRGKQRVLHGLINKGLKGSVKGNNRELMNLFMNQGANMNYGMLGATEINNNELVYYFIQNGADDWKSALILAIYNGNTILIDEFINRGGLDAWNVPPLYVKPLAVAMDRGHIDLAPKLVQHIDVPINLEPKVLGPVLLELVQSINFRTKSGNSYKEIFPLLKEGYALKETISQLLNLYLHENNLITLARYQSEVEMNEFLQYIFGTVPALYDLTPRKVKGVYIPDEAKIPNTTGKSTIQVLNNDVIIQSTGKNLLYKLSYLNIPNIYRDDALSKDGYDYLNSVTIQSQLFGELLELKAILLTYTNLRI